MAGLHALETFGYIVEQGQSKKGLIADINHNA